MSHLLVPLETHDRSGDLSPTDGVLSMQVTVHSSWSLFSFEMVDCSLRGRGPFSTLLERVGLKDPKLLAFFAIASFP